MVRPFKTSPLSKANDPCICNVFMFSTECKIKVIDLMTSYCRADWIRTSDPYVPNVVRYRAALLPEKMGNHFFLNDYPHFSFIVGWTGFEPATTCTPYKCATGLRHHPPTFK